MAYGDFAFEHGRESERIAAAPLEPDPIKILYPLGQLRGFKLVQGHPGNAIARVYDCGVQVKMPGKRARVPAIQIDGMPVLVKPLEPDCGPGASAPDGRKSEV